MSCEITVKSFSPIEIELTGYSKENVIELEDAIVCALNQKLDRISILTRGCNVYSFEGNILINDAYNTSSSLPTLLDSLGLEIKEVNSTLRGKTYIVSDKLLSTLRSFGRDYNFTIKNTSEINGIVQDIFNKNKFNIDLNIKVLDMILNIKENGTYLEFAKQEVTTDYKDNKFVSEIRGDIISCSDSIKGELSSIFNSAREMVVKTNERLKEATATIIRYRAKQMGYSIKEVRNGDKIELELVRCN